ncbi:MAG: hypothetical protein LBU32_01090 [Clostridiales bacterium]|nr:hypothetical protein [Clostridiales bacterium]
MEEIAEAAATLGIGIDPGGLADRVSAAMGGAKSSIEGASAPGGSPAVFQEGGAGLIEARLYGIRTGMATPRENELRRDFAVREVLRRPVRTVLRKAPSDASLKRYEDILICI